MFTAARRLQGRIPSVASRLRTFCYNDSMLDQAAKLRILDGRAIKDGFAAVRESGKWH